MAGAYSASKAAVIAMTKAIGKDVARTGRPRQLHRAGRDRDADPRRHHAGAHRLHGRAHPDGPDGRAGGGRRAHLLARERGVLVLDRRDLRHLRRPGGLLDARYVRVRGPKGVENGDGRGRSHRHGRRHEDRAARPRRRSSCPSRTSCSPRSRRPRSGAPASRTSAPATRASRRAQSRTSTRSSTTPTRPELFMKDAGMRRTVGPGQPIGIRDDSTWNVPEPEIGLVLGERRPHRGPHDRQRRLVARHRGREPALPPAGEDLRRRVRDRAGGLRPGEPGRTVPTSACA